MKLFSGKTYDPAAGRESRSAFVAMAAFWFAAFKFLTHGVSIRLSRDFQISFGTVDAALLGAFLIPCLGLYWGRRVVWPLKNKEKLTPPEPAPAETGPVG